MSFEDMSHSAPAPHEASLGENEGSQELAVREDPLRYESGERELFSKITSIPAQYPDVQDAYAAHESDPQLQQGLTPTYPTALGAHHVEGRDGMVRETNPIAMGYLFNTIGADNFRAIVSTMSPEDRHTVLDSVLKGDTGNIFDMFLPEDAALALEEKFATADMTHGTREDKQIQMMANVLFRRGISMEEKLDLIAFANGKAEITQEEVKAMIRARFTKEVERRSQPDYNPAADSEAVRARFQEGVGSGAQGEGMKIREGSPDPMAVIDAEIIRITVEMQGLESKVEKEIAGLNEARRALGLDDDDSNVAVLHIQESIRLLSVVLMELIVAKFNALPQSDEALKFAVGDTVKFPESDSTSKLMEWIVVRAEKGHYLLERPRNGGNYVHVLCSQEELLQHN